MVVRINHHVGAILSTVGWAGLCASLVFIRLPTGVDDAPRDEIAAYACTAHQSGANRAGAALEGARIAWLVLFSYGETNLLICVKDKTHKNYSHYI